MSTGRTALHQIDASIAEARHTLSRASDAAAEDVSSIAQIEQREIGIFRALADMRLDALRDGETAPILGDADAEATTLINSHENRVAALAAERDQVETEIQKLEAARRDAEDSAEDAIARHDGAAGKTREALDKDPGYQARASALEEANAVAVRAAQKLEIARDDRTEKGAPYEADPLFNYLWKRKFGTKAYRAFPLFALLDRWVAGLIKYRDHKLNYDRLLELPERLGEHAMRVDTATEALEQSLEEFEREALRRAGVEKLRDDAVRARVHVENLDAAIAVTEKRHEELTTAYGETLAGRAGPLEEARKILAGAFGQLRVPDLKMIAAETITLKDNRLVDDLVTARRERMEIEENRLTVSRNLTQRRRSLSDLEHLRRRFKGARFDSPYSEFSGRTLISALLSELLRNTLSRDEVWRKLERGHRTRRRQWDDDFGGNEWRDGFGLPGRSGGGDWTGGNWGGRPRRTARAPRMPRTPRIRFPSGRRSGGFKTGGGF